MRGSKTMNRAEQIDQNAPLYNLSIHANKRASQRGISKEIIELIQIYGEEAPSSHGCVIKFFPKKEMGFIYSELTKNERKMLKDKEDTYIVESDGFVITTGHRHKKIIQH